MATEHVLRLNIAGTASSYLADTVKATFCDWLLTNQNKSNNAGSIVSSLDKASEHLLKRKIANSSIWEITKPSIFADVYNKARDNKFFRIMEKQTYLAFMREGQVFLKFLKSKPVLQPSSVVEGIPPSEKQHIGAMTIKDTVIKVLSDKTKPLTAEEIYNEIIAQRLYAFGAQNPVNVVRNIIESACDNSGYSGRYRAAVPLFHFERNDNGKRIYSLLKIDPAEDLKPRDFSVEEILTKSGCNSDIFNCNIEQKFQTWLEHENYSKKTADNYCRAIAQVFRTYQVLAQEAVVDSKTKLEAISKYIALLKKDSNFAESNATRHNQFTAALTALGRFYSTGIEIVCLEDNEQMTNLPETMNAPTSSLGNIVDLEEGKEGLREIIEAHFQTLYGYSNISIVWNSAQDNLSLFLNDNAINTAEELWRFMYRAFMGEYVMSKPHIWKVQPNYPQSYVGVIINLARQFGGTVTRKQIDEYFVRIKQGAPTNATIIRQGYLAFCSPKHFILTESVDLSSERVTAITNSLDRLFECERVSYIVLRDISDEWFSSLPTLKGIMKWTPLLLQETLRLRPNIGYRVIFSGLDGQALDTLGAAIVPSKSEINSFADVVHRRCYEDELLEKKMPTEDLRIILRDVGMLEGNELIYNLHKALRDYRFAFTDENRMVKILEK